MLGTDGYAIKTQRVRTATFRRLDTGEELSAGAFDLFREGRVLTVTYRKGSWAARGLVTEAYADPPQAEAYP